MAQSYGRNAPDAECAHAANDVGQESRRDPDARSRIVYTPAHGIQGPHRMLARRDGCEAVGLTILVCQSTRFLLGRR